MPRNKYLQRGKPITEFPKIELTEAEKEELLKIAKNDPLFAELENPQLRIDRIRSHRLKDIQIAEHFMGWAPKGTGQTLWNSNNFYWTLKDGRTGAIYQDSGVSSYVLLPQYTTNISDAWEVLTKSNFALMRMYSSRAGHDFRLCRTYPEGEFYLEYMTSIGEVRGPLCESASLAICEAALKTLRLTPTE